MLYQFATPCRLWLDYIRPHWDFLNVILEIKWPYQLCCLSYIWKKYGLIDIFVQSSILTDRVIAGIHNLWFQIQSFILFVFFKIDIFFFWSLILSLLCSHMGTTCLWNSLLITNYFFLYSEKKSQFSVDSIFKRTFFSI